MLLNIFFSLHILMLVKMWNEKKVGKI